MVKRIVIISVIVATSYLGFLFFQLSVETLHPVARETKTVEDDASHKVYSFSFSKYATSGKKELEIEGDTANILVRTVALNNVIAKAYADETPVTVTADRGVFDKSTSTVYLQNNVVATTQEGARLITDSLNIHPTEKSLDTKEKVSVKKDNIDVDGLGAKGDSQLKKVEFRKNVTVIIQNDDAKSKVPTVITCEGPLDINYEKNIAHFHKNVVATDRRGKLTADYMDVFYDKVTKKVDQIIALENVVITTPEGNATYADKVTYLVKEGRVLMGGSTEAVYFPGSGSKLDDSFLLDGKKK